MLDRSGTTKPKWWRMDTLSSQKLDHSGLLYSSSSSNTWITESESVVVVIVCQSSAKLSMYSQGMLMFSHWSGSVVMHRDGGWDIKRPCCSTYLACESSLDARLNISFRRADELEKTFFSIRFWCLVLFDHSIPRDTWTLLALCLRARSSIWYFMWSCKTQERRAGQNSDVLCFFSSAGMEKISAESLIFHMMIRKERTCCCFLSPHSYPLTILQHRITEYYAND